MDEEKYMRITIKELRKIIKETVEKEISHEAEINKLSEDPNAQAELRKLLSSRKIVSITVTSHPNKTHAWVNLNDGRYVEQYLWDGKKWTPQGRVMNGGMVGMESGVDSHYDRIDRRNMRDWHG
jgi:hypothetical protein